MSGKEIQKCYLELDGIEGLCEDPGFEKKIHQIVAWRWETDIGQPDGIMYVSGQTEKEKFLTYTPKYGPLALKIGQSGEGEDKVRFGLLSSLVNPDSLIKEGKLLVYQDGIPILKVEMTNIKVSFVGKKRPSSLYNYCYGVNLMPKKGNIVFTYTPIVINPEGKKEPGKQNVADWNAEYKERGK